MTLDFSEEETKKLKEITALYQISKGLMLYSEEVDEEKRSYLQPINEFRNAFDHLMRVFAFKFGLKEADEKYAVINLDKAFGHVYRAGYDLLDFISIALRKKIQNELESISSEALSTIFPEYYREIKPYIEDKSSEIAKLRAGKDVGDANVKDFEKYIEIVENFKSYFDKILKIKPSLIEYDQKTEKEKKKERVWQILIGVIIAIMGAIVGVILTISFY